MEKILIPLLFILLMITTGCKSDDNEETNPKVKITLEDGRSMIVELYPEIAPITVENFLKLVDEKYYDGVCFHRIIQNFMVQTGGYYLVDNTIHEKEDRPTIKGEFSANGVENNLQHTVGVISMARTSEYNSASSQFFICTATSPHLDGAYAAFGKVVDDESLKVLTELDKVPTVYVDPSLQNFPYPVVIIKSIRRV